MGIISRKAAVNWGAFVTISVAAKTVSAYVYHLLCPVPTQKDKEQLYRTTRGIYCKMNSFGEGKVQIK